MHRRVFVVAAAGALALACSTTPDRPPPAGDGEVTPGSAAGSSPGNSGSSTSPGTDACNDLAVAGNVVTAAEIPGDMPPSAGGTIVSGIYNLTAVDIYVGVSGGGFAPPDTLQSTISVSQETSAPQGTIQQVLITGANSATPSQTQTTLDYTIAASGTAIFVTVACPDDGQTYTQGYTATETTLMLSDPTTNEVFTYTLQ